MKKYTLKTAASNRAKPPAYLDELNEQQLEVVMAGNGPHLVIAGAGSGKTRTITYRVARLIDSGIPPERVLLLTFTNKAARDMLHRVELLISTDIRRLLGGTFHHVANRILKEFGGLLGYEEGFTILDREDAKECLAACITDAGINVAEKRFPDAGVILSMVSLAANKCVGLEEIVETGFPDFHHIAAEIGQVRGRYEERKKAMNAMDFDDLLLGHRRLLEIEAVRGKLASRFLHVLVDEYQDTNKLQAQIVDGMASEHRNIVAVGDDCQSIYSFRGANFENIMDFPNRYQDAKIHHLEINYRSVPEILELANRSIVHNVRQFEKRLKPHRSPGGEKPAFVQLSDPQHQAEFVGQRVLELRDEGVTLGSMAVLYRSHYLSIDLQMELARRGIPFEVRSGLRFFEQQHIKDVTAYLRVLANPRDELSWKRILKLITRVGNVSADRIYQHVISQPDPLGALMSGKVETLVPRGAKKGFAALKDALGRFIGSERAVQPADALRHIMAATYKDYATMKFPNAEERIRDIDNFAVYALKYENTPDLLAELALMDSLAAETVVMGSESDEKLILSTVHQAKGLEWNTVFVLWCADGRFPSARAIRDPEGEEEERRLFYVALTRAKNDLYICYPMVAAEGNRMGVLMKPSRFVTEVEQDALELWGVVREHEDDWAHYDLEEP